MNASTPEERLTRLETTLEHLATKADLLAMERRIINWWLTTLVVVIGGFGTVIGFLYTHLPR